LSGVRCRLAYGPADALPLSKIQIGFTFLLPAHPGSPGKRAVKRVCVCVQCVSKSIWPVKMSDEVVMWLSVYSEVRLFAYGPADATAIHKPHHLLLHLNPDWFYLSRTGLPRLSRKRGR